MTREEKLAAAGAYVLGAEDVDRPAIEAQLAGDPELAGMVQKLQDHMLALDDTAASQPLNPALWAGIESRLGAPLADSAAPLPTPRPQKQTRAASWWTAIAASIVVAAGLGYTAGALLQPEPRPLVIAVLVDEGSTTPGAIVEAFADNSVRVVPLEAFAVPEGSILEVWTLPDPATGPVSLGTFSDPHSIRLGGASLPQPQPGQLYEITLEPAPGSPIGRPTGPILAKGLARAPL